MKINRQRRAEIHFRLEQPPLPPPPPPQPLRAAAVFSHGSLETTSASPRALLIGSRDEGEREWKARIPPPLTAQVKEPCAPLVTWRSCLVSTSSPSSQPRISPRGALRSTKYYPTQRSTLFRAFIFRDIPFSQLAAFRSCLLRHGRRIHVSEWLFGRVYPLYYSVSCRPRK